MIKRSSTIIQQVVCVSGFNTDGERRISPQGLSYIIAQDQIHMSLPFKEAFLCSFCCLLA